MALRNDAHFTHNAGLVDVVDDWTETCDSCGEENVEAERFSDGTVIRSYRCGCIEDQLEEPDGPDPDDARDRAIDRELDREYD